MSDERCQTCGGPLPDGVGSRAVYCSPACRQKAYRERRSASAGTVDDLIADVGARAGRLTPRPPAALYDEVAGLAAAVARLRRVARTAADAAPATRTPAPAKPRETPAEIPAALEDEAEFAALMERHRAELRRHCYRMTGSYDESEDLVQEVFLRAWRSRDGYEGRASLRTWLHHVATNACLDHLRAVSRRPTTYEPIPGMDHGGAEPPSRVAWLQPYPEDDEPEAVAEHRETMELVFLTALQQLPPRQRAALILRDVLELPAADTAGLLGTSVASVNSALQRARPVVREHLPRRRADWAPVSGPTPGEREVLRRYMELAQARDADAMAGLLAEDIRLTMPPNPFWFTDRDAVLRFLRPSLDPASPMYFGEWRHLPTTANGHPAAGGYVRRPGTGIYRAQVLDVLRVEEGRIAEITSFEPHLFPAFGLPLVLR
ncbi:hypothetical protein SRB5_52760 [Streptomyces sp. RB5]|uniref:RNA polymerase sigma factor n=1 Tax=Streptomyces smaragdinus TaxID=2585196 RepID=A0A7K0CNP3_9ACTN|nr:RNA polymerase subunit sigma-70 [Streptomyces smaragdinus]MQY15098.1 hypothetical protein [Streptomyces smaragdinus]